MKNFNSLQAQFNIRNNTMEMQEYLKDLHSWESDVKKKDKELRKGRGRGEPGGGGAPPGPRGRAASHAAVAPAPAHLQAPAAQLAKPGSAAAALNGKPRKKKSVAGVTKHAAAHTYEHYKDKWEKFDVDAALAESSGDEDDGDAASSSDGQEQQRGEDVPPIRQALDAEGWRSKGNEWFKLDDYRQAKDCYASSIALTPSCLAYANRAMASLKMGEHRLAEADCSSAIALDPAYMKAWQRRGSARLALGKRSEACADFEMALRLSPSSAALRKEFQACMATLTASEKLLPLQRRERLTVRAAPTPAVDTAVVEPPMEAAAAIASLPSQKTSGSGGNTPRAASNGVKDRVAVAASAAVARVGRSVDAHPAPKTSTEFETAWKSFRGDTTAQAAYLARLHPPALPQLFKNSLTGPMLFSILGSIASSASCNSAPHAMALLEAVTQVPRFDMTMMLLPKKDRAALAAQLDSMAPQLGADEVTRLEVARKKMKI
eukprot:jgi/Tetstr1/439260/TSEL_027702.t1